MRAVVVFVGTSTFSLISSDFITLIICYDPLNDEYPQQCVVRHNLSSVCSRTRHLTINDKQDMFVVKSILIKCQFNIIFINI